MRFEGQIHLNLSENPYGVSDKVLNQLKSSIWQINYYPDSACKEMVERLSVKYGIGADEIFFGNGIDEIILSIFVGLQIMQSKVIVSEKTFPGYKICSNLLSNETIETALINKRIHITAIEALLDQSIKAVFICNPHNPFGTILNVDDMMRLIDTCDREGIYIIIDEAYFDFISDSSYTDWVGYINRYKHLIVLKTYSKAYGLAGIRCGYACANGQIIEKLMKVKAGLPFSVNRIAEKAVIAVMDDQEYIHSIVKKNTEVRKWFMDELEQMNCKFVRSDTNFVSIYHGEAEKVVSDLRDKFDILVKNLSAMGIHDYFRVTIGTREQMEVFLDAYKQIVSITLP